jgi:hypothetical protein
MIYRLKIGIIIKYFFYYQNRKHKKDEGREKKK